jgi:hypothetical protein
MDRFLVGDMTSSKRAADRHQSGRWTINGDGRLDGGQPPLPSTTDDNRATVARQCIIRWLVLPPRPHFEYCYLMNTPI